MSCVSTCCGMRGCVLHKERVGEAEDSFSAHANLCAVAASAGFSLGGAQQNNNF